MKKFTASLLGLFVVSCLSCGVQAEESINNGAHINKRGKYEAETFVYPEASNGFELVPDGEVQFTMKNGRYFFIESPRTGYTIELEDGFKALFPPLLKRGKSVHVPERASLELQDANGDRVASFKDIQPGKLYSLPSHAYPGESFNAVLSSRSHKNWEVKVYVIDTFGVPSHVK